VINSEKIQPHHLARVAFVYVRQSTPDQLRHHQESRRRQYDLKQHAHALGWPDVTVIDDDLGKSGASASGRVGFQRLVAEVSLGRAGAVLGLEVSRLARNNRDWYQLLDLCALMNTLIIDAEGVYDPRQANDRLLLGLKGTMSEAELGWIRQRAHEGLRAKACRGELQFNLPVGYVRTPDGRIEKHPDQRVQAAIALVFQKFAELGSVRQVLLWLRQEQVSVPVMAPNATWGDAITWQPAIYTRILKFLQNPSYAGVYAYGRTETRMRVVNAAAQTSRGHHRPREAWLALLRDHHEGYISWDVYERNQRIVADNAHMKGAMAKGAPRRGQSLLAGLLRCGHCGRRLHVHYSGTTRAVLRYLCLGTAFSQGTPPCISFGGLRADQAVELEVLRVVAPGAIEAALDVAAQTGTEVDATRRALELELREARYESERAQRQYDAVEPENRLVAETLERRWNATLGRVRALEERLTALLEETQQAPVPDRATLLTLAEDFPAVWHHASTDMRLKKRLVRLLIEEIVVRVLAESMVELVIHWKGGKHTKLLVPRNRLGQHRRCTDRAIIEVVRDLALLLPDAQIARVLNRLGYRTGAGKSWIRNRVTGLRNTYDIPAFDPAAARETLTLEAAAAILGVSALTVRRMIAIGTLPARQPVRYAPWAIRREDLDAEAIQRTAEAVKRGYALPRSADPAQLSLENSGT
jgi:excisionase family DNA binding protein